MTFLCKQIPYSFSVHFLLPHYLSLEYMLLVLTFRRALIDTQGNLNNRGYIVMSWIESETSPIGSQFWTLSPQLVPWPGKSVWGFTASYTSCLSALWVWMRITSQFPVPATIASLPPEMMDFPIMMNSISLSRTKHLLSLCQAIASKQWESN